MATLHEQLLALRNPDGGWPYYAGKTSRLEPTCWALLALRAAGDAPSLGVLRTWPRRDGLLVDRSSDAVNIAFNALAGVTMIALGSAREELAPLSRALVALKGLTLGQSPSLAQDNSLRAWPWIEGTFSWTEPTALAMIFLKRLGLTDPNVKSRLEEATRLLADRVCRGGGWNYGNSNALGTNLDAYVPTTALCLLSLADQPTLAPVPPSLAFLVAHRLHERSGMALGLTRIALGVYRQPAADVNGAIAEVADRTAFLDNAHLTAVAAYALAGAHGGYEAFRV